MIYDIDHKEVARFFGLPIDSMRKTKKAWEDRTGDKKVTQWELYVDSMRFRQLVAENQKWMEEWENPRMPGSSMGGGEVTRQAVLLSHR